MYRFGLFALMVQCKRITEDHMRAKTVMVAVLVCGCALLARDTVNAEPSVPISQRNSDVSAAKQKRIRNAPQERPDQRVFRVGPPDPSIAPNGRPYPVPEYLRGQCYFDEGYGRFSPCSNRN